LTTREIWHEILVNAPPSKLYTALTDVNRLRHWWTTDTRGSAKRGENLEFWFGNSCQEMRVVELEQDRLVRWHATQKGLTDWANTDIEFNILQESGNTLLHFKHSNWHMDAKMFPECSLRWAAYLMSFKEFVETGKGRPYPYDMPINLHMETSARRQYR
jgi:uncharacterized protein YndB with AHSA1/START domain